MLPGAPCAYFQYVGKVVYPFTPRKVWVATSSTPGRGRCTGEVGLFSTPCPPNRSGQVLTRIAAAELAGDALRSAQTAYHNATDMMTQVPAGTYLWIAFRAMNATAQANVKMIVGDRGLGYVLIVPGAPALTATMSHSGRLVALGDFLSGVAPALWLSED